MAGKNLTFSGTDTIAYMMLPNTAPIVLGSLTTFSSSTYRIKSPVQTLGQILVRGVAKGPRVIAGTMVFTLINQNWVNDIIDTIPWLKKRVGGIIYSDELPIFDIMIIAGNEYGKYSSMMIYGIDLTDEAQVISVNDLYIENTFSFIAREIRPFTNRPIMLSDLIYYSNENYSSVKVTEFNWNFVNGEYEIIPDVSGRPDLTPNIIENIPVIELQNKVEELGHKVPQTGNLNEETEKAINDIKDGLNLGDMPINTFLPDVFMKIDKTLLNNNNYYAKKNLNTATFPSKNSINHSNYEENQRIIALKEYHYDNNDYIYTNKGWVDKAETINIPVDTPKKTYITDVNFNGNSVMENITHEKTLVVKVPIEVFLNTFYIEFKTDKNMNFVSNISYKNINGEWKNSIKKEYTNGITRVYFSDRQNIIDSIKKDREMFIILSSNNESLSYMLHVVFNEGNEDIERKI